MDQFKKYLKDEFRNEIIWGIEWDSDQPQRLIYIYDAIKKLNLPSDLSIIDVACGHATVINGLRRIFLDSKCKIVDIRRYKEWDNIAKSIVKIELPLQRFILEDDNKYDIVMMLNSYRFWDKNGKERIAFDKWLIEHAKYFITSDGKLPYEKCDIAGNDYRGFKLELYKLPLSSIK